MPIIQDITQIVGASGIARYDWPNRGVAPKGYIKGMAVMYARIVCKFQTGDAAAREMAKGQTNDENIDALKWYEAQFSALGANNNTDGIDTLRNLFVLMVGLGMRESSGKHCEGRDQSAHNTTGETAEAGLFQTSWNARFAHPVLPQLFSSYSANPDGFVEIFREGVHCSAASLKNHGTGQGKAFQRLSKECPAFAVEFAAVGLRNVRSHWGPINSRSSELRSECFALLRLVEDILTANPGYCLELI